MDHKISALPGGAPLKDTYSDWLPDVALRVDVMMLEQVEALEDKVANASMQVKVSAISFVVANTGYDSSAKLLLLLLGLFPFYMSQWMKTV
jgi:hypothetical protein